MGVLGWNINIFSQLSFLNTSCSIFRGCLVRLKTFFMFNNPCGLKEHHTLFKWPVCSVNCVLVFILKEMWVELHCSYVWFHYLVLTHWLHTLISSFWDEKRFISPKLFFFLLLLSHVCSYSNSGAWEAYFFLKDFLFSEWTKSCILFLYEASPFFFFGDSCGFYGL